MSENCNHCKEFSIISASCGGAAEKVLRAISHVAQKGVGDIKDTNQLERLGFAWREVANGTYTAQGIFRVNGKPDLQILLVLGAKTGLFLKDVERLDGQHFSTNPILSESTEQISYAIPISQSMIKYIEPVKPIWKYGQEDNDLALVQITSNIRRAVNEICSIIIKHPGSLLKTYREEREVETRAYHSLCNKRKNRKHFHRHNRERVGICDISE